MFLKVAMPVVVAGLLVGVGPVAASTPPDDPPEALPAAVLFDEGSLHSLINLMDPDGSDVVFVRRRLGTTGGGAAFVPSGKRIVFSDKRDPDHNAPDIYRMRRDGTHLRQLTIAAAGDTQPDPSPDGRQVIFTRTVRGASFVFRMRETGETESRPAEKLAAGWDPEFTPDGRRIVFISARNDSNADVWIMRSNGTHLVQLTRSQPERDANPVVSPDGRQIVWVRETSLFHMRIDGTHKRRLTDPDVSDRGPVFSPNGAYVMFSRVQDLQYDDVDILRKPFPKGAAVNLSADGESTLEWVQDWWSPRLASVPG